MSSYDSISNIERYSPNAEGIDEDSPLIDEGEYDCSYISHYTRIINRAEKLQVKFRILNPGKFCEKRISRYYNVRHLGKDEKNGRFCATKKMDCFREMAHLLEITRNDRIPITKLKGRVVRCRVRTVTHDRHKKTLDSQAWYSVVDAVLGYGD